MALAQWSPAGWQFLHSAGFAYTETASLMERQTMYKFLVLFGEVLPCPRCRQHYREHTERHLAEAAASPALAGREALSRYLYELHDAVNVRLGKSDRPTWEWVRSHYTGTAAAAVAPKDETIATATATRWEMMAKTTTLAVAVCIVVATLVLLLTRRRTSYDQGCALRTRASTLEPTGCVLETRP